MTRFAEALHSVRLHLLLAALAGVLLAATSWLLLPAMPGAWAGDMQAKPAPPDEPRGIASVLDGRTFQGQVGHVGNEAFAEDAWVFDDGMFLSESCIKCGYSDSPYWVRFENDGVHFKSESRCPVTDATIVWRGLVSGDQIEGTFTWTKERWYWTIEKEFWFRGNLVDRIVATTDN